MAESRGKKDDSGAGAEVRDGFLQSSTISLEDLGDVGEGFEIGWHNVVLGNIHFLNGPVSSPGSGICASSASWSKI